MVNYVLSIKHYYTLTKFTVCFIFFQRADIESVKLGFQAQEAYLPVVRRLKNILLAGCL